MHAISGPPARRPEVTVRGFEPEVVDLFCSRDAPRRKLEVARRVFNGPEGLVAAMGDLSLSSPRLDLAADRAARIGSWEVRAMQQGWGCFNPTRPIEPTEWCFEQFRLHEVAPRIRETLARTAERVDFEVDLVVVVVPADPANLNLMVHSGGASIAASPEGCIALQIWPDAGNLQRLEAVLSRALRSMAAFRRRPPESVGDLLRIEGAVTRDQVEAGEIPSAWQDAPWCVALAPPPGHADSLQELARACGHAHYEDLPTNVYGQQFLASDAGSVADQLARCAPHPLDRDQLDETAAWLQDTGLLDSTDARDAAAVCFGDLAVERVGHPAHDFAAWAGLQCASLRPDALLGAGSG